MGPPVSSSENSPLLLSLCRSESNSWTSSSWKSSIGSFSFVLALISLSISISKSVPACFEKRQYFSVSSINFLKVKK